MEKSLAILENIAKSNDKVSRQGISAVFEDFGESALKIHFIYFIQNSADRSEAVSTINLEILKQFSNEGIEFAYPTQTIYVDSNTDRES